MQEKKSLKDCEVYSDWCENISPQLEDKKDDSILTLKEIVTNENDADLIYNLISDEPDAIWFYKNQKSDKTCSNFINNFEEIALKLEDLCCNEQDFIF